MAYLLVYLHFGRKGIGKLSQRKIAILSICAAWFAVLCAILLGVMIGKHLVVLVIFSAISAFFVTLTWAIRLRNPSVQ